jgi:hypothetical protein
MVATSLCIAFNCIPDFIAIGGGDSKEKAQTTTMSGFAACRKVTIKKDKKT